MSLMFRITTAAVFGTSLLISLTVRPAFAQLEPDAAGHPVYYVTGDYTLSSSLSPDYDIYVGRKATYPNGFGSAPVYTDLPGPITFTLANNAIVGGTPNSSLRGVSVYGNNRADIAGGGLNGLYYFENSSGTISSGQVGGVNGGGAELDVHDSSTLHITGGTVEGANVWDTANLTVSGGAVTGVVQALGNSHVGITGGAQGGVWAENTSTVTLANMSNNIDQVMEQGQLFIASGSINTVDATNQGTVHISGGTIGTISNVDAGNILVTGGTIGYAYNNSNSVGLLNIYGGTVNQAVVNGGQTFNAYGGSFYNFVAFDSSKVRLWDGDMTAPGSPSGYGGYAGYFHMADASTFTFYGQGLTFSNPRAGTAFFQSWTGIYYDVAWTQWDGTVINSTYFDKDGSLGNAAPRGESFVFSNVAPQATAPEPGSVALAILGLCAVAGFRARRHAR